MPQAACDLFYLLSRQHPSQVDPKVRDAILRDAGTIISLRAGGVTQRFWPKNSNDFLGWLWLGLPNYDINLKLVDGTISKPFSATTLFKSWLEGCSFLGRQLKDDRMLKSNSEPAIRLMVQRVWTYGVL